MASSACSEPERHEKVGTTTAALSSVMDRTLGFESLEDWSALTNTTLSLSANHTEGQSSLSVLGGDWIEIISRPLSKEASAPEVVAFDVRVPNDPINQWWSGSAAVVLDAPSVNIWDQSLGFSELPEPTGQFARFELPVDESVRAGLQGNYDDLTIRIVLNVLEGQSQGYLLDRFQLGLAPTDCTPVDDGNPCTIDACDAAMGVSHTPVPAGTACDDGDPCNGQEVCSGAGVCSQGAAPVVDDGNPCTADSCDSELGVVHVAVSAGTPCADANLCNGEEVCNGEGVCTEGASVPVPPDTACIAYSCDPSQGIVTTFAAAGVSCDDGTVCNGRETCNGDGVCLAGAPLPVPPPTLCSVFDCDAEAGIVRADHPAGTSCANDTVCDGAEVCDGEGGCLAGTPLSIPAASACVSFSCDDDLGVMAHHLPAGTACSDGDVCNGAEACDGVGSCADGVPLVLPPDTACTTYSCDPTSGIQAARRPVGFPCDNNNLCDGRETCDEVGECVAGAPPQVDDGNPCTADSCDPTTGVHHAPVADGTSCGGGSACSGVQQCFSGECVAVAAAVVDDGNPCTVDICDPSTGEVVHVLAPAGTACPELDACHDEGTCDDRGQCTPGEALSFDDGDPCTVEVCDPVEGLTRYECEQTDGTIATVPGDALAWLYTGINPVQRDVLPGTIDRARATLISGRILGEQGLPLSGVTVKILNHPELGSTVSQANGVYQMVVNGGGDLVVWIAREGFLDSQRTVRVPWTGTVSVQDIVLLQSDPLVTYVDLLDTSEPFQIVQGSTIEDDSGARRGTALVPAGTIATMTLPDGTTEELDELDVRITEFTVGEEGPLRMPGTLPPLSRYTYAFEINADQAVAAGAPSIEFSEPLVYYVDNFLGFPSGTVVPVGSYDRALGIWEPEESGVVMTIVSVTDGLADVSIDADAAPESPAELLAAGITEAERAKLAALYPVGKSLWRVLIPHFTSPWDLNWNAIPPPDAVAPPASPPPSDTIDTCEVSNASTIECQNQVLREAVPIAGTSFSLNYSSQRVPGWASGRAYDITLSGPTVPASLEAINLSIQVGGRTFSSRYSPAPNQSTTFVWDGLDAFDRGSMGRINANITVDYEYPLRYVPTPRFGSPGSSVAITGDRARSKIWLGRSTEAKLGFWDQRRLGLGGWSLSAHHAYDASAQTLYRGDGTRQGAAAVGLAAHARFLGPNPQGIHGGGPTRVLVAPDGSVLTVGGLGTTTTYHTVNRIRRDGSVVRIAGSTTALEGFAGDGGPATLARLSYPEDLELAPDGTIYIADTRNHRIRKVTRDGVITTIAGTGVAGFSGDNGPATQAQLNYPKGLGLGPDGALYVADRDNYRVRKIGTNGIITTVAGRGSPGGGNATLLDDVPVGAVGDWLFPADVAVAVDGSLLITHESAGVIRRVSPQGRVFTIAGVPCLGSCPAGQYRDGVPARQSGAGYPESIQALPDGSYYFTDRFRGILHYVDPDGIHHIVAGGGTHVDAGIGIPARSLDLGSVSFSGAWVGPDGIVVADKMHERLITLRVASYPSLVDGDALVAAEDASEIYHFDPQGRHLTTREAITGSIRYQFGYDSNGLLATVTDAFGNQTDIERAADGKATAIVGPNGQRTELGYDSNDYLGTITNPMGQSVGMSYTSSGLLTAYRNARGQASDVQYDPQGRLVLDRDAAGSSKTLGRTRLADGWQVALTSPGEGTKTYEVRKLLDGREQRTTHFADGTSTVQSRGPDGVWTTTLPDGTIETVTRTPDPRFGIESPIESRTVRLPSCPAPQTSCLYTEVRQRTAASSSPIDPFPASTLIDTRTINGKTWTESYDATNRTWTLRSPVGRRLFRRTNALGDLVEQRADGLLAQLLTYDSSGRLSTQAQGTRQSLFTYFTSGPSAGYLESARNPLLQITTFARDAIGRPLEQLDPLGNVTAFSWDPDSNLASVTPPGQPPHEMSYTPVNLMDEYTPPVLASVPDGRTIHEYNLARQVELVTRPDGLVADYTYDSAGRLEDIITPGGTYHRQYYDLTPCAGCAPGRISRVTSPDAIALDYTYDGPLTTGLAWSGSINGSVSFAYNTDFNLRTEMITSASGGAAYHFAFDLDSLLTCASPTNCATPGADALRLTYHPNHGLPTGSTLGTLSETLTYNTLGELATQTTTAGGSAVFSQAYDSPSFPRDALGRITRKVEALGAATNTWDYTYDLAGRLTTVALNGSAYESYTYDANSNRLTVEKSNGTTSATYDDQDRLLTYGPWTYTYTANGELATKTNGTETWSYTYDVFGNLKRVDLPSGDVIEYLVDGHNRRVGKKRNGALVKQWLYRDQLHPSAELDGAGNLVARFVWASGKNTPDLVVTGGVTYRVFTDQLGSPRMLVNASTGAVAGVMRHDAWGVVLEDTVSTLMPFGFAGGLYDAETGLVRFGARDYDASIGRWVSKDPIGFGGGQANLYVYVGSDPINGGDATGLYTEAIFWEPVGVGSSSFGHVSILINGTSYSWGPGGMHIDKTGQYVTDNVDFRSGRGLVLSLTPAQEYGLEDFLRSYSGDYNALTNNCTDPIEQGLTHVGARAAGLNSLFPTGLARSLSSLAIGQATHVGPPTSAVMPWSNGIRRSFYSMY